MKFHEFNEKRTKRTASFCNFIHDREIEKAGENQGKPTGKECGVHKRITNQYYSVKNQTRKQSIFN